MRSDLAVELGGPASGDLVGTARAPALASEVIFANEISVAADERVTAARAACVFGTADASGKISRIDEAQS